MSVIWRKWIVELRGQGPKWLLDVCRDGASVPPEAVGAGRRLRLSAIRGG